MIKEIKNICLGYAYDFIDLDKYTNNKDSIKVTFEDSGEEFTKWTLSDSGFLKIECGIINYKKYDNPYEIKVIVEYEPSELPLSLDDINTLEGLRKNIIDLKSMSYISAIRFVAYKKFNLCLNQFVLFNSIVLDRCGQTMRLKYEHMEEYDYSFYDFITMEFFSEKISERISEFSICSSPIPNSNAICPHCGQKWNLHNLRDCIRRGEKLYHIDCNKFSLYEKSKSEFDYVASNVFTDYKLRAVKNEYGSEDYNGYWFIINTDDGDIKIGWRKRVIEIKWLENYKKFTFNGENEDVTKSFSKKERYIHADDVQKAIEYLQEAKLTIIK